MDEILSIVKLVTENDVFGVAGANMREPRAFEFSCDPPLPDSSLNYNNISLLHIAAAYDSLETFIFLTRAFKFDICQPSLDNYFPLHYACDGNSLEIASFIIDSLMQSDGGREKLKQIFEIDYQESNKYSLIDLCSLVSSHQIIELILGAGYSVREFRSVEIADTWIRNSIVRNSPKVLSVLLKETSTSDSMSPIMIATSANNIAALRILLQDKSLSLNYFNSQHETALSIACLMKNTQAVKMLVNEMTFIDLPADITAKGAVHWLCESGDPEIALILLNRDIDVNRIDEHGKTGVSYLDFTFGEEDKAIEILNMLYERGFNIHYSYVSPIEKFITSLAKSPPIIEWFLQHGLSLETRLSRGQTVRQVICSDSKLRNLRRKYVDSLDMNAK